MTNSTEIKLGWKLENSYARLPKSFFSLLEPTPVRSPKLILLNKPLAKKLGLHVQELQSREGVSILAGNRLPKGSIPLAQAYAGHQFGHFTMLGDGRALLIGEQITPDGELMDIQLKGSGPTPYSRGGDGRAALGPMLREYIISEAMHALHIPTTRSLAVVTTGESIFRDNEQIGAILTRVATSHIRVGTFQYVAHARPVKDLQLLADYTLQRHFPNADQAENRYLVLLEEVVKRQAALIAQWQRVGFIHGVMNTDNMTISGETIDYGPCAFMDTYDPATVFSSIDRQGRYAYGNQPAIAGWNLARFAETLLPLIHDDPKQAVKLAQDTLSKYTSLYQGYWLSCMRAKLGLFHEESRDKTLIEKLLQLMKEHQADFTNTFRSLTLNQLEDSTLHHAPEFKNWYQQWQARLNRQVQSLEASKQLMQQNNPNIIPRNHQVEAALASAEKGDYTVMEKLLDVLSSPFAYSAEQDPYTALPEKTDYPYQTYCGT